MKRRCFWSSTVQPIELYLCKLINACLSKMQHGHYQNIALCPEQGVLGRSSGETCLHWVRLLWGSGFSVLLRNEAAYFPSGPQHWQVDGAPLSTSTKHYGWNCSARLKAAGSWLKEHGLLIKIMLVIIIANTSLFYTCTAGQLRWPMVHANNVLCSFNLNDS